MAGSRVLVQEGIYDEFLKKLIVKTKEWVVGDPFDPQVNQGPQVLNLYCSLVMNEIKFLSAAIKFTKALNLSLHLWNRLTGDSLRRCLHTSSAARKKEPP